MKTITLTVIFCLSAVTPLLASGTNGLSDEKLRLSYSIGVMTGSRWKQQGIDVDYNMLLRGLRDGGAGSPTLMTEQEVNSTLGQFSRDLAAKQKQKWQETADKNKQDGETFLAENKSKPGVVTMPDGLQYKVITDGNGSIPAADDIVTVNYRGTLIDGTEFDKNALPAQFRANGVIHGWTEALTHMKVGSKWQLFVPSELAYGQAGRSPHIGPNAVLFFEIELLSTQSPPPLTSDIIKVPSQEEMKKGAKIEVIKSEDAKKLQQSPAQKSQ